MRWLRFRSRRSEERERAEEMRAHLALLTEQLVARGRSPEQAEREARLQFGNPRVKLEEVGELNRVPVLETIALDVRNAIRSLRAAPAFTAVVLAVLTLATGATTAMFSVIDAVALRGLPFEHDEQLVAMELTNKGRLQSVPMAARDFLALRNLNAFDGVAAIARGNTALRREAANAPEGLTGQRVSWEFFSVLRVSPAIGRAFTAEQEVTGRDRVAVISDRLWRRRFGGAADVIGKHLPAATGDIEVIGVMPPGFAYPVGAAEPTELWTPYVIPERERSERSSAYLHPIARLARGVTIDDAHARIDALDLPLSPKGVVTVGREGRLTLQMLRDSGLAKSRPSLFMLLAAVACVLVIAAVNIANLQLVRANVRMRELSVRTALGATRWQIARLLLTESLVLSFAGTALGVLAAWWSLEALTGVLPPDLPRAANIAIDLRVLGISTAVAIVTGVGFGLAPAFQRVGAIDQTLRAHARSATPTRSSQWLRATFLVTEVAFAVVLLVGAALFLTSFAQVVRVDVGLDYRNVLLVNVTQGDATTLTRIVDEVQKLPGVESAAIAHGSVPFSFSANSKPFTAPVTPAPVPNHGVVTNGVSADYFHALGIRLTQGRAFTAEDIKNAAPVVIINESTVATYFPQQDPIGQTVDFSGSRTVIGVVNNVRGFGPESPTRDEAYLPISTWEPKNGGTLIVKTTGRPAALAKHVSSLVWSSQPDIVIPPPQTLAQRYGLYVADRRLNMVLLSLFGLLAVAIAGVGIYGVMSFVVAQRTREIGIRMALGAQPATILRSVLRRASVQVSTGGVAGLGLAWLLATSVKDLLFRVAPHDIRLYLVVGASLAIIALVAAYLPARRAARVDPLIALRGD